MAADLSALSDLCTPWCLHVVVTLRVAEHIAEGKNRIAELGAAAGADPGSLMRVMRHLISKGIFDEPAPGEFALNGTARGLMEGPARLGFDLEGIGGRMAFTWSTLLHAVRTGRPAFHEVFGRPFWEDLDANPQVAESFDALMGVVGHGVPDPEVLLDPADWAGVHTVVDVGGGTGALLAEVLRKRPHLRGTLVDLPRVVRRSAELFEAAGVADRVEAVGQSFFDSLPSGKDIYIMKNVLGDWPDAEAKILLHRCAEAARPNGLLVMLGGVTPEEKASPELLMLVLVGGKNRTLAEFRALAASAGLEVRNSGHSPSGRFVVELKANN
jgi:2,7-dihydroxy-5-methyl-1-naphthoate 7-O-methyltransferase